MAINKMIETALGRFQISTNISDDGPLVVFLSGAGQFDTLATYHNVITQLPASVNWLTVDYLNTGLQRDSREGLYLDRRSPGNR